jgi:hypothetical protein
MVKAFLASKQAKLRPEATGLQLLNAIVRLHNPQTLLVNRLAAASTSPLPLVTTANFLPAVLLCAIMLLPLLHYAPKISSQTAYGVRDQYLLVLLLTKNEYRHSSVPKIMMRSSWYGTYSRKL